MRVRECGQSERNTWDDFVRRCPTATLFHRFAWRDVIADTMRHRPVYLLAEDDTGCRGVLPLFVLRTGLFGTMAVSMPFLNYGGVAADDDLAARALLDEAKKRGREAGCKYVEFRHRFRPAAADDLPTSELKVTSILDLTPGADVIWNTGLHQNVRNKIRKAQKHGVVFKEGKDQLDAFCRVFAIGQRQHGTPVLPRAFFARLLEHFGDDVHVYVAYHDGRPIGGKVTIDHGDTRYFIWSASVSEANRYAPVPGMNWRAIEDAIAAGRRTVDFGRSSAGSSSQSFKKYWGVSIEPLYWQYHLLTGDTLPGLNTNNPKFELAIRAWRRLPLWLTRLLGPPLARRLP